MSRVAPRRQDVDQVRELLQTYGPARAYDYMQQAGGLEQFPLALLTQVRQALIDSRAIGYNRSSVEDFHAAAPRLVLGRRRTDATGNGAPSA